MYRLKKKEKKERLLDLKNLSALMPGLYAYVTHCFVLCWMSTHPEVEAEIMSLKLAF